jgi:digalactosyldiacylglycerol synthase
MNGDLNICMGGDFYSSGKAHPSFLFTTHLQAKQLMHSASNVSLERVASQIMEKPREALTSAQQTLNNCQQNLATLKLNLRKSFSESKASLEERLQVLGEPGSPSSSGPRLTALLSRVSMLGAADNDTGSPGSSGTPWDSTQSLPSYLQSLVRRGSVESLVPEGQSSGEGDDGAAGSGHGSTKQPWGPFQKEASRRRKQRRSSLREDGRQVTIVTTAALPWMTGTAVNPLLRAAYLAKDGNRSVTLMIPWLAKTDQERVFPNNITFESPEEQEKYVRDWARQRTGFSSDFTVTFYPGRYAPEKCSILPVGDPTAYVPDSAADVAILEEPEHLTWYHHGRRWTDKFAHVVGVVHTNYLDYARREEGGPTKEALLRHINSWVTRVHCHKVVKLSDAVQDLPRQTTEFVHGVAESFLTVGEKKAKDPPNGGPRFSRGAYFIGKCVWAKGYTELLELLTRQHNQAPQNPVAVDCFGAGEDLDAVKQEAERRRLAVNFHGARDHLHEDIHEYRVFINPSTSDVVATTTAEALAMGKWVVVAEHPSNRFFSQFNNCLVYTSPEEFVSHVQHALSTDPAPITPEDRTRLTWEAATERFLDVAELTDKDLAPSPVTAAVDSAVSAAHNALCGVEVLRQAAGAGANTKHNPPSLLDYEPSAHDVGGLFDDKRRAVKANAKTVKSRAGAVRA